MVLLVQSSDVFCSGGPFGGGVPPPLKQVNVKTNGHPASDDEPDYGNDSRRGGAKVIKTTRCGTVLGVSNTVMMSHSKGAQTYGRRSCMLHCLWEPNAVAS